MHPEQSQMAERQKACEQAVKNLAIKMKMRPLTRRVALAAVPLSLAAIALPIFSNTVGAENGVTPAVTPAVTPPAPLFTECPAIGHDTGCQFLVTLPASGPATITEDKNQGPYDGSDDTLVGIVNDTAVPIPSVNLSSTNDIFHFDGDGICSHGFTPFVGSSYCTNGNVTTGYEGPINTFSGYTSSDGYTTGVVNFDALAPGASTFFSLESSLSGVSFIIPADFSVTKSVTSPGPYYAGDASTPITYRLAAHNFGGVSGPVQIQDTVPTGTTLVTGSDACPTGISPATCSVSLAGSTITWNLFDVGSGVTIDVGFSVTPNASTSNYSVSNTAVWDGPGCATDPIGPPPIVTESAAVTPDVALTKCPTNTTTTPVTAPTPLVITASNTTSVYGTAGPAVTPTYTGLTGGDTQPKTPPTCTTVPPVTATTAVGTYTGDNKCSGAADPKYTITYVNGNAVVTPAPLVITASSASVTAGAAVPTITAGFKGFVNADSATNLTTQPTCSTTYTTTSAVGSYTSSCKGVADPNYTITYVPGTVTVTAAVVTSAATSTPTPATTPATTPTTSPAIAFTGALLSQEWVVGAAALLLGMGLMVMARYRRRKPRHAAK